MSHTSDPSFGSLGVNVNPSPTPLERGGGLLKKNPESAHLAAVNDLEIRKRDEMVRRQGGGGSKEKGSPVLSRR